MKDGKRWYALVNPAWVVPVNTDTLTDDRAQAVRYLKEWWEANPMEADGTVVAELRFRPCVGMQMKPIPLDVEA